MPIQHHERRQLLQQHIHDEEREKLYAVLQRSTEHADRGETVPFDDVMTYERSARARTAR